jgi:hypothetical protein
MRAEDIFYDQYKHSVTQLFKGFINILEDLQQDHIRNFNKLRRVLPNDDDLIELADYFDDDKFNWLRKKTLDLGNDCIRNINDNVEKMEIKFTFRR